MFDLSCGLRLREYRQPPSSDIDDIMSMHNNAQVAPLINDGFAVPRSQKFKDAMQASIESNSTEIFCIVETIPSPSQKNDLGEPLLPEFVGITGLWSLGERGNRHGTFSISLMPQFWSKGYGTEVTKFILKHAFVQMNMHRISLQVFEGNERAISLYKNMGFVDEGTIRKARWANGKWRDTIHMGILVEEWVELQKLEGFELVGEVDHVLQA